MSERACTARIICDGVDLELTERIIDAGGDVIRTQREGTVVLCGARVNPNGSICDGDCALAMVKEDFQPGDMEIVTADGKNCIFQAR